MKIKFCPKCESTDLTMVAGATVGMWECKKCKWKGTEIKEDELSEDELMKYLDEKGEKVS